MRLLFVSGNGVLEFVLVDGMMGFAVQDRLGRDWATEKGIGIPLIGDRTIDRVGVTLAVLSDAIHRECSVGETARGIVDNLAQLVSANREIELARRGSDQQGNGSL